MMIRTRTALATVIARFHEAVEAERPRVAKLLTASMEPPVALREALDIIQLQQEELTVADNQLQEALAELTRVRGALDAKRDRYASVLSLVPDALIVTDARGVIRQVNDAAATLLRNDRRALRAKSIAAFVAPNPSVLLDELLALGEKAGQKSLRLSLRGGVALDVEARVRRSAWGTTLFWNLREVSTVPAADQERLLRDRTELLQRERQLRLELEHSRQANDRLIAMIAQDLRPPTNAILGWTRLLQSEHLDQAARQGALAVVERSAQTQARLLDELLDLSRLETDRLQLNFELVDVTSLVRRTMESARSVAVEREISLTSISAENLTLVGDGSRLELVVASVVSNALRHTPKGGWVRVIAENEGDHLRLTVADSGDGIAKERLPLIFAIKRPEQNSIADGSRVGLHVVRHLVELHDGTMTAASEGEGRGTTFTITFARSKRPISGTEESRRAEEPLRRLRVLVVDDEDDERELVSAILRRAGAEVAGAKGVAPALAIFESWTADVVVSDILLPDGQGCELLAKLRREDPFLAAIAVSGFPLEGEESSVLDCGFDGRIEKPIDAAELVELVDESARAYQR